MCIEWLWGARLKMARTEYAVNLASFIACMLGGVEAGIGEWLNRRTVPGTGDCVH